MQPASMEVALATALAWLGALAAAIVRRSGMRLLRPMVYLALLFFAAAAIFDILPEAKHALTWPSTIASAAAGYVTFWLIGRHVAPICPACAIHHFEAGHRHHPQGVGLVVFALVFVVHCFLDGLGVAAAETFGSAFALRVFGAIAVHKVPEGFALALVLMTATRGSWTAVALAAAIETATLAGAAASWLSGTPAGFAAALAYVGGTFLYLSVSGLRDALPSRPSRRVAAHP
jgi:zinc transporter ZupT